jgi:hypothetical protein
MSSKEQEACKALQAITREATSGFDSKQSPEKQWEYIRCTASRMDSCVKALGLDMDNTSNPFCEAYLAIVLSWLGKGFVDRIIILHLMLGKNFFKDPAQVEFSKTLMGALIVGEGMLGIEAAKKTNNAKAQAFAAMEKTVHQLVDYAVMCRGLGIKVRGLVGLGNGFRGLFCEAQYDRAGTVNFVYALFASLEQNGLIGNEERDDILYTYAEIDEMIAFANDPRLRAYVDSLTAFRVR